ncbi:MmcQ/YjbR family DNA-binding protein [candidate division KSB1 bacterium]
MDSETLKAYCLNKRGTSAGFPFGEGFLVMKVGSKVFAIIDLTSEVLRINLKCDPHLAMELRDRYEAVKEGYHMNKLHWNTVHMAMAMPFGIDGNVPEDEILSMIDHSYELVFKGLKKSEKDAILKQGKNR